MGEKLQFNHLNCRAFFKSTKLSLLWVNLAVVVAEWKRIIKWFPYLIFECTEEEKGVFYWKYQGEAVETHEMIEIQNWDNVAHYPGEELLAFHITFRPGWR